MRIVLFRSVDNLGSAGDIVDVKRGYYRNFLGPRGFAKVATKENMANMESQRKKLEVMVARERDDAGAVAESITGAELKFTMRSNDQGQLFGSVTSMDIAKGLTDLGHTVDRRKIEMPESIKSLGSYEIRIRVYPSVYATISAVVERELTLDEIRAMEDAAAAAEEVAKEQESVEAEAEAEPVEEETAAED